MDTQNTPIHIHLWHADFWLLALSNLLITMSVYLLIPVLPAWMLDTAKLSNVQTGMVMGIYAVGLFIPGAFCNWLVQRYRRNWVCLYAMLFVLLSIAGIWSIQHYAFPQALRYPLLLSSRLVLGASFGLVQMVLSSTLIIDKSESFQRTEANHASAWFGRFALSLGPMLALVFLHTSIHPLLVAMTLAAAAFILLISVHFPFRTPEEYTKPISTDRFFLPAAKWLFLNLFIICVSIGMLMAVQFTTMFYALVMVGFALALLAERYAFANADLKSQVVSGVTLIVAALIMMLTRTQMIVGILSPIFIGLGIGLIGARFLLFFIKLSRHCQRGTSVSTCMLAWESGIATGLFVAYALLYGNKNYIFLAVLIILALSLALYLGFTHTWYMRNKNR